MAFERLFNFFDGRLRRGKPASLYLNSLLRGTALSLVGIFGPLYVLYLTKSLFWVLFYYILMRGGEALAILPMASLVYRLRFRWSVLLSNFILILKFMFLILAKNNFLLLIPASLLASLQIPLYWLPYHLIFAEDGAEGGFEEDVGVQGGLGRLSSAVTPFLGGIIISQAGFPSAYALAAFLIFLSSLPLFFTHHHRDYGAPSLKRVVRNLREPKNRGLFVSFFGRGIDDTIGGVCWPLFAFPILGSYQFLGGLSSGATLLSLILLVLVSRWGQGGRGEKALFWGGITTAMIWPLYAFSKTPLSLFSLSALQEGTWIFFSIPFSAFIYEQSLRDPHPFEFMMRRELVLTTGRVLTLLLLFPLFYFRAPWLIIFSLGAMGMLLATRSFKHSK